MEFLSLATFNLSTGVADLEAVIKMPEAALLGRQKESGRKEGCSGDGGGGGTRDPADLFVHLKKKLSIEEKNTSAYRRVRQ